MLHLIHLRVFASILLILVFLKAPFLPYYASIFSMILTFGHLNNCGAVVMKVVRSVYDAKLSFIKFLGLFFSSKLDLGL